MRERPPDDSCNDFEGSTPCEKAVEKSILKCVEEDSTRELRQSFNESLEDALDGGRRGEIRTASSGKVRERFRKVLARNFSALLQGGNEAGKTRRATEVEQSI